MIVKNLSFIVQIYTNLKKKKQNEQKSHKKIHVFKNVHLNSLKKEEIT